VDLLVLLLYLSTLYSIIRGIYVGTSENKLYPDVMVSCKCNLSGILSLDFSNDNILWETDTIIVNADEHLYRTAIKGNRYFRVKYQLLPNSIEKTTSLNIYTYYGTFKQESIPINRSITNDYNIPVVKSVLSGNVENSNNINNIQLTNDGYLKTTTTSTIPIPICELSFLYGINNFTTIVTKSNGGDATIDGNLVLCSTGLTTNSYCQISSKKYIKFRLGKNGIARFNVMFGNINDSIYQYAGVGFGLDILSSGIFFGYNGMIFGIFVIKKNFSNDTITKNFIEKHNWNVDVCDGSNSINNKSGFNLTPNNMNMYQIKYYDIGLGYIYCYIQYNNNFILVHIIENININDINYNLIWRVENYNPDEALSFYVISTSYGGLFNEKEIKHTNSKYSSSHMINIPLNTYFTYPYGIPFLLIKNCNKYNGIPNTNSIQLKRISFSLNHVDIIGGICMLSIIKNPTLTIDGYTLTYTCINGTTSDNGDSIVNGNSITSVAKTDLYDDQSTLVINLDSNSYILFESPMQINNTQSIDLTDYDIYLNPNEIICVSISTAFDNSITDMYLGVSILWNEDI
jgi:hypothetical protein